MNDLELYQQISYSKLEQWFDDYLTQDPNSDWKEYGNPNMGEEFIVINTSGVIYSFVFCGYNQKVGAIFRLIFKE